LKNDNVNLKELLSNARQATTRFQELAEAAEARVVENTEAGRILQDRYEQQLAAADVLKQSLEKRVGELEAERDGLVNKVGRGTKGCFAHSLVDTRNRWLKSLDENIIFFKLSAYQSFLSVLIIVVAWF
jgi:hypothetical protein